MPVYCAPCARYFGDQQALDQHRVSLPHCIDCNRIFNSRESLHQHRTNAIVHKRHNLKHLQTQNSTAEPSQSLGRGSSTLCQPPHFGQLVPAQVTQHGGVYGNEVSPVRGNPWSLVPVSQQLAILQVLSASCHSTKDLLSHNYLLEPYNEIDLVAFDECTRCRRLRKKVRTQTCWFHDGKLGTVSRKNKTRQYSCCNTTSRGCKSSPVHEYQPSEHAAHYRRFVPTPAGSPGKPTFKAISLDCEMVGVNRGRSEVIFVCAADYLTGAVILNKFVCPDKTIIDWRTNIHGITNSVVKAAVSKGQAIAGWKAAREVLWNYIDENTILVGHALQHDLDVLRMIHPRIVDSAILAQNAVNAGTRQWGLQKLCHELLDIEIRKNERGLHDCLEDVLATREVVLWCTHNEQEFGNWAQMKKLEAERMEEERKVARERESSKRKEIERRQKYETYDSRFEDPEVLHWSDIAEDCGWPHPDTGYDPWSD